MESLDDEEEHVLHASHHEHHGNCCSHDHHDEIEVYRMTTEAKLAACDGFRRAGLELFREGQWRRARNKFQKILVYLDYTFPSNADEEAKASELKQAALLNSAVCTLKQDEFRETISICSQVLREWEDTAQAWFLRGKAKRLLGEFTESRDDLNKALQLKPSNRDIQKEIHIVDSDERIYKLMSSDLAQEMFSSTSSQKTPAPSSPSRPSTLKYSE